MAAFAFRSVLVALLFVVTRCSHRDNRIGFHLNHNDFLDPFAVSKENDDVKRPFGGGEIFSRWRTSGDLWGDQRSLTPWAMSKFIIKEKDAKRHHSRPPNEEEMNYDVMKRPFGPMIYTRPFASRKEKRPFGGNVIFSKPRGTGAKLRFGGYTISRERRGDSLGTSWMQPIEISDRGREKSHSSQSQNGWEEKKRDAWLEGLETGGEGRKNYRQMSFAPFRDDYKNSEVDSIFGEEQVDDEGEEADEKNRG